MQPLLPKPSMLFSSHPPSHVWLVFGLTTIRCPNCFCNPSVNCSVNGPDLQGSNGSASNIPIIHERRQLRPKQKHLVEWPPHPRPLPRWGEGVYVARMGTMAVWMGTPVTSASVSVR